MHVSIGSIDVKSCILVFRHITLTGAVGFNSCRLSASNEQHGSVAAIVRTPSTDLLTAPWRVPLSLATGAHTLVVNKVDMRTFLMRGDGRQAPEGHGPAGSQAAADARRSYFPVAGALQRLSPDIPLYLAQSLSHRPA